MNDFKKLFFLFFVILDYFWVDMFYGVVVWIVMIVGVVGNCVGWLLMVVMEKKEISEVDGWYVVFEV